MAITPGSEEGLYTRQDHTSRKTVLSSRPDRHSSAEATDDGTPASMQQRAEKWAPCKSEWNLVACWLTAPEHHGQPWRRVLQ